MCFCEKKYLIISTRGIQGPHSFESVKRLNLCICKSIIVSKWANTTRKGLAHVSRTDIEVKVRKTIETFIIESVCDLVPLLVEVQMNGLYILLSKMDKIMDQTMFEDPE